MNTTLEIEDLRVDRAMLLSASREELIDLARTVQRARQSAAKIGPQTNDELHAFIKKKWGIHIPRVAVSPGMSAPFDMVADVYFFRETSVIGVANREGSKTTNVAIIHALFANFFPGYEGISAGAINEQTKRVYNALKRINKTWGNVRDSQATHIEYKNGSVVEPKDGTEAQMNGPHSWLLHRDEVEQFRRRAFDEADNITKSGVTTDGREFPAIDILTTSRKKAHGLLQELLDQVDEANKNGTIPPYKVYMWGVAETIANQPNCRMAPQNIGRPDDELCNCHRYVKGKMRDGTPRSMDKICAGRFFKSDGWRPREPDIAGKFMKSSPAMWDAQQECTKPATEGLILADFSKETHGIRGWVPDPELGKIYLGIDFGGTNAHAANWYQYVEKMCFAKNYSDEFIFVNPDTYVVFDEVYLAEVGNNDFAKAIKIKEIDWRRKIAFFEVEERYGDIAAKAARIDFNKTHGLKTTWRITREVNEHISIIQQLVGNDRILVDVDRCPMWCAEAEAWQWDDNEKSKTDERRQLDTFNHAMSAARYAIANIERKLTVEGRHPDNRVDQQTWGGPAASSVRTGGATNPLHDMPSTGPAFKDYNIGSPHDVADALPIHQGPMSALGSDRMFEYV